MGHIPLDLSGKEQTNGFLKALRPTEKRKNHNVIWLCLCTYKECNKEIEITAQQFKNEKIKSCKECKDKIGKRKNLEGYIFEWLEVIEFVKSDKKSAFWLCRCICGREKIVSTNVLTSGHAKSCGECGYHSEQIRKSNEKRKEDGILHKNIKDFTGHRQGSLTVKEPTNKRMHGSVVWLCECDCGNICYKSARHLMNDKPAMKCGKECILDIKGKKFGMCTVEGVETNWRLISGQCFPIRCRCDCGEIFYTSRSKLKRTEKTSCGCIKLKEGEARFNELYYSYTKQAEKRGYKFNLTKEQVRDLFSNNCYYCGASPQNFSKSRWGNGDYRYNGIDRFNNEPYYNSENTVSCCKTCNLAKMSMTAQEFFEWVERVYNHRIKDSIY